MNTNPNDNAEYGHTRFSDLSPFEFQELYYPTRVDPADGRGDVFTPPTINAPPLAFDWREQGAVTPVKDQGSCGSCWAESAVGNMESIWYLAHKDTLKSPIPLSVQQVIECDPNDNACYGGFMKGAYKYVLDHGGLAAEADYPYNVKGKTICLANQTYNETCGDGICDDPPLTSYCDTTCTDTKHKSIAKFTSWKSLPTDEDQIAAYLVQSGPVSVGIDAGGPLGAVLPWLQFYKRGVANPRCSSKKVRIDHGVLIVGFGEDKGEKYWTVKNSWGPKFGEEGYFRIIRGVGKCAINTMASTSFAAGGEVIV